MIPYDDLVAALSAWRARQGLPVSTMSGGGSGAAPQPGSGPHAQPGSGPYGKPGSGPHGQPGSGPQRGGPPAPPPAKQVAMPPPLADEMPVEEAEMLEEQYDAQGSDYAMSFRNPGDDSTAIGEAPGRATDPNDFGGGRGGGDDW